MAAEKEITACGEHSITQKTCERLFKRFKSGSFDVKPGASKTAENF